jgi:hypothetical protein
MTFNLSTYWPNTQKVYAGQLGWVTIAPDGSYIFGPEDEPAKGPEIPPEVWNDRPISKEACMAAVRAMCS